MGRYCLPRKELSSSTPCRFIPAHLSVPLIPPDLRRIPVVVLTSSDAEKDVVTAYEYHANGYVVKPMGFEAFCELVGDVVSYWLVRNRLAA